MILLAIRRRDSGLLREALLALSPVHDEIDEELLERSLARFTIERLGSGAAVDAAFFGDMFELIRSFRLGVPPEIAAVGRCFVTLEGTLRLLDPDFNVLDEVQRQECSWLGEAVSKESLRNSIQDELSIVLPRLRRLPGRLDHITAALDSGRLTINVRMQLGDREERLMERLVGRVSLVIFGPAVGVMSVVLLGTHGGPNLAGSTTLNQILGYSGLCISVTLILRGVAAVGWSSKAA
jgi:ubiquinone biosynthesis protein